MNFKKLFIFCNILFMGACSHLSNYNQPVKNSAGETCANGVGGCRADEDRTGDFISY